MPKMSYRGRILIINNLVASSLWHRFTCVDPPVQLLTKIQAILVDFFWDKLHWVPQNVLFLPKEEGGHGLVHLQSRIATFRLQFVQKTVSWFSSILNGVLLHMRFYIILRVWDWIRLSFLWTH